MYIDRRRAPLDRRRPNQLRLAIEYTRAYDCQLQAMTKRDDQKLHQLSELVPLPQSFSNGSIKMRGAGAVPCELGLGCVTFGREIDWGDAFTMMDYALGNGVTTFDTAAAYGGGISETIVGSWIARRAAQQRVKLATKILPPYTPASIDEGIDASLRRLGVNAVQTFFLHHWDDSVHDLAVLAALDRVVQSGRARALGASNFTTGQLERVLTLQAELGIARFSVLQSIHNLAIRGVDDAARNLCRRSDVTIETYSPLGAGFLTGKHEHAVQPRSRFDLVPGHQKIYFNDLARHRLARLQAVAAGASVPMTLLALAWALHQPQIATVLVGGRTPAHLEQALLARAFQAPELLCELDSN